MPRPFKCRKVRCQPGVAYFKPCGVPACRVEEVVLAVDEFEAVRLADFEGMYQEDAAKKMDVSRQTFGNILTSAHKKISDSLVNAKALKIEGGTVKIMERHFMCYDCKNEWALPCGVARSTGCPKCKSNNFHRMPHIIEDQSVAEKHRLKKGASERSKK